MSDELIGAPGDPSYLRGKHWHPGLGWTNHGEAACRAAVRESDVLADLRLILEKHRARQAKDAA